MSQCLATAPPLTILSDYFSNNNFLKAEDFLIFIYLFLLHITPLLGRLFLQTKTACGYWIVHTYLLLFISEMSTYKVDGKIFLVSDNKKSNGRKKGRKRKIIMKLYPMCISLPFSG